MLHGNGFKGATLAIVCVVSAVCVPTAALAEQDPPKLVLQITVDALRADLPERYLKNMGKGGFRYLLNEGIHYTNAHYQHANTETVVGHASLATGAPPAVHGMIGNVWFDRAQDRVVYNIEDANYSLLTAGADVDKDTELDTTQKAAKSDDRSPMPFLSSTLSDEIASAYKTGKSKIFLFHLKIGVPLPLLVNLVKHSGFLKLPQTLSPVIIIIKLLPVGIGLERHSTDREVQ